MPDQEMRAVLQRLESVGFTQRLEADGGELRVVDSRRRFSPATLAVVEEHPVESAGEAGGERMVLALVNAAGEPVGTYVSPGGAAAAVHDLAVLDQLRAPAVSGADIHAHQVHDHIAAVFPSRDAAVAAVDDLRRLGLGSEQLGVAVHAGEHVAFERDADAELEHDIGVGAGSGAVVGFFAGFAIMGLAVAAIGTFGVGGLLALGAASGLGGSMLGGYFGVAAGNRAFTVHDELAATKLQPDEVLVAVCSHGQPVTVREVMERHDGSLRSSK